MHRLYAFALWAFSSMLATSVTSILAEDGVLRSIRVGAQGVTRIHSRLGTPETQQDEEQGIRYPRSTPKFVRAQDRAVSATMRLAEGRPVPLVEAVVNGKGPFLFFLDTGAGTATIDAEFARELKLPTSGKTNVSGPGDSNGIVADIVTIDRFQIGELDVENFEAAAFDRSSFSGGEKVVGSIGIAVFGDLPVKLDFGKNLIEIGGGELDDADDKNSLACDFSGPVPIFGVELGGMSCNAAFDSGFAATLLISDKTAKTLRFKEEPTVIGKGRSVSDGFELKAGTIEGSLQVGQHQVANPTVTIMPEILVDREICVLGHAWGKNMSVTFDAKNRRVRFEQSNRSTSGDPSASTAEYAGKYGARTVFVENKKLMYQREGGPAIELEKIGEDRYKFVIPNGGRVANPLPEVRFDRDEQNRVKGFSLMRGEEVEEYCNKDEG